MQQELFSRNTTSTASVATQAFLVHLSISQWTGRKMDKQAAKETKAATGATDKAGVRVYKNLVAAEALDKIKTLASAAYFEHRKRTVPWSYEGQGAITAAGYADYIAAMNGFAVDFKAAVKAFLSCYEAEREAQRGNLGAMFNEADYPPVDALVGKFAFSVSCEPMPQSADFRVAGLSVATTAAIRADMDAKFRASVSAAQSDAWNRIVDRVHHLKTKLEEYKPAEGDAKAQGIFRDSLVGNIKELIGVLPSLNISGDPELTAIAVKLERELCAYTAGELRVDDNARAMVANKAQDIMQEIWAKRRATRTDVAA